MINVYLPQKHKTKIRGYWQNGKKIYYDYISIRKTRQSQLPRLKYKYKQEALFYCQNRGHKAYIWQSKGKVNILKHRLLLYRDRQFNGLKTYIRQVLKSYGGLTVHIKKDKYLFEIWR